MKITAQEEYGLRILIRIAACKSEEGMSIPQLSKEEGLSSHYIAKLTRILRMEGFINSTPGYKGGYVLAMSAQEIKIKISEVASRKKLEKSLMPEGLVANLTLSDFASLLDYLQKLSKQ